MSTDPSFSEHLDSLLRLSEVDQQYVLAEIARRDPALYQRLLAELQIQTRGGVSSNPVTSAADSFQLANSARTADSGSRPRGKHSAIPSATIPELIADKYQLVEIIGEGGMGTVWRAEQIYPIRRPVAIKLIKTGVDSRQVLARFEAERQVLALMDHPNIARILDGGTLEPNGMPYFAMEFVDGIPIARFCDQQQLSIPDRLKLFIPICDALQHAHQKGIIHRDLKPTNILVTTIDGNFVPKVIDFGVAKAMGQSLTDRTLDTLVGAVVGTPLYMSPEQANVDVQDIDTRSDVYSLGVVLYELLTGGPPFDRRQLGRAAVMEILRIIREVDPPTPSSRLSTDEGLPTISANRQIESTRLSKLVRGELDWIVMKALEKERDRRYDSARSFGDDIRRYLMGETVLAAPPSRTYRYLKFLRRHRGAVIAATLLVASLVAGIVGTSIGMFQARSERILADIARKNETKQRIQAEQATQQAFKALQSFTDEFVERQFASKSILSANDRAILQKALQQWEVFADAQGDTPQSRRIRAEGLYRVANLRTKLGEGQQSIALLDESFKNLFVVLAQNRQDADLVIEISEVATSYAQALRSNQQPQHALAVLEQAQAAIALLPPTTIQSQAILYAAAGITSARGVVLRAMGDPTAATAAYDRAIAELKKLVATDPDYWSAHKLLGVAYNNHANLMTSQGKLDQAESLLNEGLNSRQLLVKEVPDDPEYRIDLAFSYYAIGDLFQKRGNAASSRRAYEQGLVVIDSLHREFPLVPEYRDVQALLLYNLSVACAIDSDADAELQYAQRAADVRQKLVDDFPEVADFQEKLAAVFKLLGGIMTDRRELNAAQQHLAAANLIYERLIDKFPNETSYQADGAEALARQAQLAAQLGQSEETITLFQKSLASLEQLNQSDPPDPKLAQKRLRTQWNFANALQMLKRQSEACEAFSKAVDIAVDIDRNQPQVPQNIVAVSRVSLAAGDAFSKSPKPETAKFYFDQAIAYGRQARDRPDCNAKTLVDLAGCHTTYYIFLGAQKQPELAAEQLELSHQALELGKTKFPDNLELQLYWCGNAVNRADGIRDAGNLSEAVELLNAAYDNLLPLRQKKLNHPLLNDFFRNALNGRAECHDTLQDHLAAARDWRELSEIVPAGENTTYISKTAQSLVRGGEHAEAVAIADSLGSVTQAPTIFARARIYSVAFGLTQDNRLAEKSMAEIDKLIGAGLDDVARLKNDPDLAALQENVAFQELLKKIK